jgi:hypothetical protein
LSPAGITEVKYSLEEVSCSRRPVSVSTKMTPFCLEVLTDLVVDDLGLVLRGHAGDEALLLGLGDAERS